MANVYITALIESLEKKRDVLKEICLKNAEQYKLATKVPFPESDFDKNSEEKGVLIYKLNKLDEGFELTYEKVREELGGSKEKYKSEILTMQQLIAEITDLSTKIQADELRNKNALEKYFKGERSKLKGLRSQSRAARSYQETMSLMRK